MTTENTYPDALPGAALIKALSSLFLVVMVAACSTIVGDTPTETNDVRGSNETRETIGSTEATTTTVRDCVDRSAATTPAATGTVAGDALTLSAAIFTCADDVVVVGEADINQVATAAQLAAALGGPLLHPHEQLTAELARLTPLRVHVIGNTEVTAPPSAEVSRVTTGDAVSLAGETLGIAEEVRLPATPDSSTIIETVGAINGRDRVVLPQAEPPSTTSAPPPPAFDPATLISGLGQPFGTEFVWLVDASQPAAILSAAANGKAVGASVVAYDPANILGHPEIGPALSGRPPTAIHPIGTAPETATWELNLLTEGAQVPGGGFRVFPADQPRRYVAFYGHPETTGLGALGEQGPQATLERMAPMLAEYGADGAQVIPTFEIIASIASAGPTDGDYSEEWPPGAFEEWIQVARDAGAYVILDLQPGREDFLSQAMQYQELLMLPFVGLALDPEWRLEPDQVHLRQVGQVDAAEVNTVVDWLADLVRDNGLPQKMLIVHQFQSRMIVDRETLKQRPELQMVIQMDGQGPIPTKEETYAVLTSGTEDAHWRWGWKNFFDEDSPETASPAFTIDREPVPVFVSYQ